MFKNNCNFYLSAYFLQLNLNFQIKTVIPGKGIGVWFFGFLFPNIQSESLSADTGKISPTPPTHREGKMNSCMTLGEVGPCSKHRNFLW